MRFVYVDEAGTSAKEPVSVVVGIIVDADRHWRSAQRRIQEIVNEFVPKERRKDFIFHAKQIWGDEKLRLGWRDADRHHLLHAMMRVPFDLGLAISIGMVRRNPNCFEKLPDKGASLVGKMTPSQWEHLLAFAVCLQESDRYIRNYGEASEIGAVVAENVPAMAKFLGPTLPVARANPWSIPDEHIRPTLEEQRTGIIDQHRDFRVERLVDTVHFVEKRSALLLQIADACAFGMRRWLAGQSSGLEFARSIVEDYPLIDEDWAGGMSGGLFYWHPQKPAPKK